MSELAGKKGERLFALDVLRGLDMFLLVVVGPVFGACAKIWAIPKGVAAQFNHAWGGFTLWDIIMPLFIFMCGAAVPLALPRRLREGRPTAAFWKHIASRVALLWFLGMVAQGYLLTLEPAKFNPYSNTLQAIATGYVMAALALFVSNVRMRRALPFLLVLVYSLALAFGGDYSPRGNFAWTSEEWVRSLVPWPGNHAQWSYTWILTSLMFGAITLFGAQATEILTGPDGEKRKCGTLAIYGAGLLAVGWLLVPCGIPMIKHIFTASFTLQAVGWSMLALAFLYLVCDILKLRRWCWIFVLFGQCALFAYMVGGTFRGALVAFCDKALGGVPSVIGARWQPLVVQLGAGALLSVCLYCWRLMKKGRRDTP